ncbi:hypothetical protein [Gymnodinialimonas ceratoperidinii]|uniref:Uncharacterized protein n=1 Tax=Gymnodinialimonas ceratoperidinii TaxID=2856823 RepID=A0A8F6YBY8_9RHOB|nr:hypothetical protein [Gymnodinialimonas ceratoperidinii]QXT41033.1 hypothetical protein KYE46_07405 [Gymnodinialimonas ceratoperidinii]
MSGRVGYAVFDGDVLVDWAISRKAARSEGAVKEVLGKWLEDLGPHAVVTEALTPQSKKRGRTPLLLDAIENFLAVQGILQVRVIRERPHRTKYVEAEHLIGRFPILEPWRPERPHFYDNEPNSVAIFEAVALATQVLRDPMRHLAGALG